MKTCKCLVILLMLAGTCSWAQETTKVDSLKKQLSGKLDRDSYPVLWGLAWELFDVNNPEALFYARRAHATALKMGDTLQIVKSGRITGQLLRRVDEINASIEVLSKVLPIAERHGFRDELKLILNALALSYAYTPDKETALEISLRVLSIREEDGNPREIASSLNNIGLIYDFLELHQMALEYYFQAMASSERAHDDTLRHISLVNIGLSYLNLNDTLNANKFFKKGIEVCYPNCVKSVLSQLEYGYGFLSFLKCRYQSAEEHFSNCIALAPDNRYRLLGLAGLMRISVTKGDIKLSEKRLALINAVLPRNEYEVVDMVVVKVLADFYILKGDYVAACKYLIKANSLRENRSKEKIFRNVAGLQVRFAENENLKRIKTQSELLSLQEEAIALHSRLNLATTALICFALMCIFLLARVLKKEKWINRVLDSKVRERTQELENSHSALQHVVNEQLVILRQISGMMASFHATWKGLTNLATLEDGTMCDYFREADETIDKFRSQIDRYTSRSEK